MTRIGSAATPSDTCKKMTLRLSKFIEQVAIYYDKDSDPTHIFGAYFLSSEPTQVFNIAHDKSQGTKTHYFGIEHYLLGFEGTWQGDSILSLVLISANVRCLADLGLITDRKPIMSEDDAI